MKALESLIEQSLITKNDVRNQTKYKLTEKGGDVLNYLKEATNILKIEY